MHIYVCSLRIVEKNHLELKRTVDDAMQTSALRWQTLAAAGEVRRV